MPTPRRKPIKYKPATSSHWNTRSTVLESFDYANGVKCPYCGSPVQHYPSSTFIYKTRDLGPVWCCSRYPGCNAYVGCHPGTEKPKGPLADSRLRSQRIKAHEILDQLVRINQTIGIPDPRSKTYQLLANKMNRKTEMTHIGWFNHMEMQHCLTVLEELKKDYGI